MKTTATAAIAAAIILFLATVFSSIGASMILNPEAVIIVIGGTLAAVSIAFSPARLGQTLRDISDAFRGRSRRDDLARQVAEISRAYRKSDIRGVENRMREIRDEYLRVGVNLLINHHTRDYIRMIMERELALRVMSWNFSQNVLKTAARVAPSLGLAGTVLSLVRMFRDVTSPEAMAPVLAVAMLSTLYGVIISSLLMLPLCAKLRDHAIESEALMHLTIEGIEAVSDREHPLRIEEMMKGFRPSETGELSGMDRGLAAIKGPAQS